MAIQYPKGYVGRLELVPSTLTVGTIYWSVRNQGNPGETLRLARITGVTSFTGTAAATRSVFGLHRKAGTPTGGVLVPPTLLNSGSATGQNEVRFANAGLGGVTIGTNDQFATFGQLSQIAQANYVDIVFEDENPLLIEVGEFLCIYAHTALVSGVAFHGHALWYGT